MDFLYKISKKNLTKFLVKLDDELYAPVKTDAVRFQKISNVKDIHLESQSDFPVKEFFFREREKLFSFKGNKISVKLENPKPRVFFGLRRCDLNAVAHQDYIFMERHKDPYYTTQRKGTILLGYHCNEMPSKYCFCGSMDLEDYYDMMFFDKDRYLLVHAKSDKGKELLTKHFKKTDFELTEDMKTIEQSNRLKNKHIKIHYNDKGWEKGVSKCLSCAACTTLCPTCYCHEIKDETKLTDLKQGNRVREWSSCQLKSFTRVAGDHIFRDSREERFKHRIYHQLQYFKERYNVEMCVGCGRCITHCPTEIDFIEIINEMSNAKK